MSLELDALRYQVLTLYQLATALLNALYMQQANEGFQNEKNITRMRSRWGAIANPHTYVFDPPSTHKSHPWGMIPATE